MASIRYEGKLKGFSVKVKVSCLLRKLVENRSWFSKIVNQLKTYKPAKEKYMDSVIDFDRDIISLKDKLVLLSSPDQRKPEDIKEISVKLALMHPFLKYPHSLIEELIKYATLTGFEKGKVLFKAKDEAIGTYFVLSGIIEVYNEDHMNPDPMLNIFKIMVKEPGLYESMVKSKNVIIQQGHIIGRKEVIYGEKRHRTAVVTEDILVIKFKKKYMMETMKPLYTRWYEVYTHLKKFEILHFFSLDNMREVCQMGEIKEYRAKSLVDVFNTVSFLIEGEVAFIQRILVQKYRKSGRETYKLYKNQNARSYDADVEPVYMQVLLLSKGAFFGLGEDILNRVFWTNIRSKFIQFPREELLKLEPRSVWAGMRLFLEAVYPTSEQLINRFIYTKEWIKHKKDVESQVKKSSRPCTIHDVPIPMRFKHSKVKRSFMKKVNMYGMKDYLDGGYCILDDELRFKLDLNGADELREKICGKYKTDPYSKEEEKVTEKDEEDKQLSNNRCPTFIYFEPENKSYEWL